MRFRAGVPLSDILEICRPLLLSGGPSGPPADLHGPPPSLPELIGSLEPPEFSGPDSLTLVGDRLPLRVHESLQAALVMIEDREGGRAGIPGAVFPGIPTLRVRSLHGAMEALIRALSDRFLHPEPFLPGEGNLVSPTAVVDGILEGAVTVGAGACVGSGSYIGAGTRIGPNAVIHEYCFIGRNCVIQAGAVIGSAGFGFFAEAGTFAEPDADLMAMPHPAGVEIGDDCWIGANTVIAAGVLSPTVLGRGCKIDSLVQIAHNVRIGEGCQIAAHCGIAGSTVVGRRFRMGGSAGLNGHIRIGDDVSVAAFSGVTKDLPDGVTVAGFPARPIAEWRRQEIGLKRLAKDPLGQGPQGRGPSQP